MANGKHYCNSNPCLFCASFHRRVLFSDRSVVWLSKATFQILSISDWNEMLSGRSPETLHWVEDAVRQSRRYCNLLNQPSSAFPTISFSETGSPPEHVPMLVRAIALRDSTCSESTLLNALRWDYISFLFVCYIFMILLCCWVAAAFKNNQSLYSFRKLDRFCE